MRRTTQWPQKNSWGQNDITIGPEEVHVASQTTAERLDEIKEMMKCERECALTEIDWCATTGISPIVRRTNIGIIP